MQSCERNAKNLRIRHVTRMQLTKKSTKMSAIGDRMYVMTARKKNQISCIQDVEFVYRWICAKRQIDINKPIYWNLHIYSLQKTFAVFIFAIATENFVYIFPAFT